MIIPDFMILFKLVDGILYRVFDDYDDVPSGFGRL